MPPGTALPDPDALAASVSAQERAGIATALNLLDDRREASRSRASQFLSALQDRSRDTASAAHLIGITGPPGAGKSSLSAALINHWRHHGKRIGVLAVDPSSPISGGALLGDRLRMKTSAQDDNVFVRSLACRGEFGGLSAEVWPMCLVMLAAFDIVLVETVGVGQREIDVADMCDTTCYVAQPGSGDSIQFIKAGILEVPHILVVNKEDMGAIARRTLSELGAALARAHPAGGWEVPVLSASATRGSGIEELANTLQRHQDSQRDSGQLHSHRHAYQGQWLAKRLGEEFGSFGVELLGGEQQILEQLTAASLFEQYELLRASLLQHWKKP